MPGRLFLTRPVADTAQYLFGEHPEIPDNPRHNIAPGEEILVCTKNRTLSHMRWGIIPVGRVNARGRPVMETIINARSETVFDKSAFQGVERCLIPCDGWYEWTGKKRRKTPWRISLRSGEPVVFAGICDAWNAPNGTTIWQVAVLTCEPNADVRDIHHRMGCILPPEEFEDWLNAAEDDAAVLLKPLPDGMLTVEAADDVDWAGP